MINLTIATTKKHRQQCRQCPPKKPTKLQRTTILYTKATSNIF